MLNKMGGRKDVYWFIYLWCRKLPYLKWFVGLSLQLQLHFTREGKFSKNNNKIAALCHSFIRPGMHT